MEQEIQTKQEERIVRILSKDLEGGMKIYPGLAKIKGISWALSNAVCKALGIDKNKKIGSLNENEIKQISEFIKNPELNSFLLNRRKDFGDGKDKHLSGSDLELARDFDIKRLKQIKSYRGIRHVAGLPTKGQRTRANFRKNKKKGAGIKKKSKKGVRE